MLYAMTIKTINVECSIYLPVKLLYVEVWATVWKEKGLLIKNSCFRREMRLETDLIVKIFGSVSKSDTLLSKGKETGYSTTSRTSKL